MDTKVDYPHTASDLAKLRIINPIAEPHADTEGAERHAPAARPSSLKGKTVALYWNGKQNGLDALARVRENFTKRFQDIEFVDVIGELGGTNRYLSADQIRMLGEQVDVAVCTSADCGSCTSWLMRDLCELERAGIPAAGYTAAIFTEDAHFSTKTFGLPEAVPLIVAECFSNKTTEEIRRMVDDTMPDLLDALTVDRKILEVPPSFEHIVTESAPELIFSGEDLLEAFDDMQRRFVSNGWSDGLPLIPPTHAKVDAMIEASGRDGSEVVGLFAPGFGVGTVRKIAANAVMAGCRPDAMPVILAMMDCILDPSMGLRTWAMSTGPQAPIVLVSGDIADEIGMNRGICALGQRLRSRCHLHPPIDWYRAHCGLCISSDPCRKSTDLFSSLQAKISLWIPAGPSHCDGWPRTIFLHFGLHARHSWLLFDPHGVCLLPLGCSHSHFSQCGLSPHHPVRTTTICGGRPVLDGVGHGPDRPVDDHP